MIIGGFPCQDVSSAGKREGIKEGNRSGLWFEFRRAVESLRPRYVLIENVSGLISGGGLDIVLAGLGSIGYRALRPVLLEATSVGAPHPRERVFIVAWRKEPLADPECDTVEGNGAGGKQEPVMGQRTRTPERGFETFREPGWWTTEPPVGRVAHGVPARVDRLKGLGNAVVPQCAQVLGLAILALEKARQRPTRAE